MTGVFDRAKLAQFCLLGTICALLAGCGEAAQNEAQTGAQTAAAAVPDLMGGPTTTWRFNRIDGDDFLPPVSGPGPVKSDPAHPYVPNDVGGRRDAEANPTYRVADLTSPILTDWAKEKMKYWNDMVLEGKTIPFEAQERCYPPGVPSWNIFRRVGRTQIFFVQTPKVVWMIWRGDNQVRRVYLDVPHSANPKPTWFGESVGHYEGGDTLVVDTIGVSTHPLNFVDNYRTPHTEQLHVIERYRLIDGGKAMDVDIHVEDPGAFTMPWNALQKMYRAEADPLEENVCAEMGLSPGAEYFGLQAVQIPQTTKPDF